MSAYATALLESTKSFIVEEALRQKARADLAESESAALRAVVEGVKKACTRDSYRDCLPHFCYQLKLKLGIPALANKAVELVPVESIRAALAWCRPNSGADRIIACVEPDQEGFERKLVRERPKGLIGRSR